MSVGGGTRSGQRMPWCPHHVDIRKASYVITATPTNSTTTADVLDTLDNSTFAAVLDKKQNYDDSFISHCCVALIRTVSAASSSLFAASSSMWLPHL